MSVILETTIGDLTIDLYTDDRPQTCMNFIKLCKMKFYNHHLFYSIERDYIAQTGDPTGTGKGGESVFRHIHGEDARFYEGEKMPIMKHKNRGTVSMVSCGKDMYGSQFFLTLGENLDSLDDEHLVFGEVVEGLELVSLLNQTLIDEAKRPYKDIRITHTVVLFDPFPDPDGLIYPEDSPRPPKEMFQSLYIAADEDLDEDKSKSIAEIQEEIAIKEASARATILEMVGDIPDADMAPPENVLFVCKLNAVTTSEDLEIIFSRFGKIICVEVIRDKITGNSLQYAFVEFDNAESCENAYFKMDNVLIDDRRIHVDFSQSVAKIKWKGKGRGVEYYDDSGCKVSKVGSNNLEKYSSEAKLHRKNYHGIDKGNYENLKSNNEKHFDESSKSPKRSYSRDADSSRKLSHYKRVDPSEQSSYNNLRDPSSKNYDNFNQSHNKRLKYSSENRSKYSPENRSKYSYENRSEYSSVNRAKYRSDDGSKYSSESRSKYSPDNRCKYRSDDRSKYSSEDRYIHSHRQGKHQKDSITQNKTSITIEDSRRRADSSSVEKIKKSAKNNKKKRKSKKSKSKSHHRESSSSSENTDSESLSMTDGRERKKLIKQLKKELKKSKK